MARGRNPERAGENVIGNPEVGKLTANRSIDEWKGDRGRKGADTMTKNIKKHIGGGEEEEGVWEKYRMI